MKTVFPCYTTSFLCACTVQDATKRISEAAACQHNNLKIIEASYSGVQRIILRASADGCIYHNSFMPITKMELRAENSATQVSILFELMKSTKVFIILLSVFALLSEIMLFVFWITNQLAAIYTFLFPLVMLIFGYALSSIGLLFSSKVVLWILFVALTCEDTKRIPAIHKRKHIV